MEESKFPRDQLGLTLLFGGKGFLMIFSSMIPSSLIDADWSRLLGVGVGVIFIGQFIAAGIVFTPKNTYF